MTDLRRYLQQLKLSAAKLTAARSLLWSRSRRARSLRGLLALCAVVVLAQGVELTHSHDEPQSQLDCHICLKLGNKGKAVAATSIEVNADKIQVLFVSDDHDLPYVAVPPAKSRAPPHYS